MVAACFRAPQSGHPPRGNLDFRRIAHLPDDSHGEDEAPVPLYADTVTSLAVGLAAGALVLGLAATVIALRVASRLDGAREEGRRTRKLAEVTSTLDLDVLLERTLAATCALPGVESASVALTGQSGAPLAVASTGYPEGAAARASRSWTRTAGRSAR
jgi:hypothetical protein